MSKNKFKLNRSGVRELMQSEEMQSVLKKKASGIKNRCGDGYEQDIYIGRNRANAMVWADTPKASAENNENNTILKAVRG